MSRPLPADVYDYLELCALAFGGIGGGMYREGAFSAGVPLCGFGCGIVIEHIVDRLIVLGALLSAGLTGGTNDAAVEAINKRRGKPKYARVPWKAYVAELRIVRVPNPECAL